MIENLFELILNIATLTVIMFSSHALMLRAKRYKAYLPLAICLLSIAILISQPTLAAVSQNAQLVFLILSLPALLLISPCFWLYVQAITSERQWVFQRTLWPHFVPFLIGCVIAFSTFLLPDEIKQGLLIEGSENVLANTHTVLTYLVYGLLIVTFVLVLGWVFQSTYYFVQTIKRLSSYRQHLKHVFASTESKEVQWLSWLLIAIATVWLTSAVTIILDNLFFPVQWNSIFFNIIMFVMIWSVSIWGLRQKPGFEEIYAFTNDTFEPATSNESPQNKYQNSALDNKKLSAIAVKIEYAMHTDKLYLDAALSLQKLAKHIEISPNYLSQTLNQNLGMNFFDFVNQFRIVEAKKLLKQTDRTVLDIAMSVGFNAKSSFYTAFKKETQLTPSQFKRQES